MISHFAAIYPEETFSSACARYCWRLGIPKYEQMSAQLFGLSTRRDLTDFPYHLDHFVSQLPPAFGITKNMLIFDHSTLPFFRPFWGERLFSKMTRDMSEPHPEIQQKITYKIAPGRPSTLRYCPVCVADDRRTYGETYWHRSHQIGYIPICLTHRVLLKNSSALRFGETSHQLFTAQETVSDTTDIDFINSNTQRGSLMLWLAEQGEWLSRQRQLDCEPEYLVKKYRHELSLRKLASQDGKVNTERLYKDLEKVFRPIAGDFLELDAASKTFRANVCRLFRSGDGNPVLHYLLLRFLNLDMKKLIQSLKYTPNFEPGPWPCLNKACNFFEQAVIPCCKKFISRSGKLAGIFSCKCGYTYARLAPDILGTSRFCPYDAIYAPFVPDGSISICSLWLTDMYLNL